MGPQAHSVFSVAFPQKAKRGIYQEGRVWILTDDGSMVEELPTLRTAYEGHERRKWAVSNPAAILSIRGALGSGPSNTRLNSPDSPLQP